MSEGEKQENAEILAELNKECDEEDEDTSEENEKEGQEWDDHTDLEMEPNPNTKITTAPTTTTPETIATYKYFHFPKTTYTTSITT